MSGRGPGATGSGSAAASEGSDIQSAEDEAGQLLAQLEAQGQVQNGEGDMDHQFEPLQAEYESIEMAGAGLAVGGAGAGQATGEAGDEVDYTSSSVQALGGHGPRLSKPLPSRDSIWEEEEGSETQARGSVAHTGTGTGAATAAPYTRQGMATMPAGRPRPLPGVRLAPGPDAPSSGSLGRSGTTSGASRSAASTPGDTIPMPRAAVTVPTGPGRPTAGLTSMRPWLLTFKNRDSEDTYQYYTLRRSFWRSLLIMTMFLLATLYQPIAGAIKKAPADVLVLGWTAIGVRICFLVSLAFIAPATKARHGLSRLWSPLASAIVCTYVTLSIISTWVCQGRSNDLSGCAVYKNTFLPFIPFVGTIAAPWVLYFVFGALWWHMTLAMMPILAVSICAIFIVGSAAAYAGPGVAYMCVNAVAAFIAAWMAERLDRRAYANSVRLTRTLALIKAQIQQRRAAEAHARKLASFMDAAGQVVFDASVVYRMRQESPVAPGGPRPALASQATTQSTYEAQQRSSSPQQSAWHGPPGTRPQVLADSGSLPRPTSLPGMSQGMYASVDSSRSSPLASSLPVDLVYQYVSTASSVLYGKDPSHLRGTSLLSSILPEDRPGVLAGFRAACRRAETAPEGEAAQAVPWIARFRRIRPMMPRVGLQAIAEHGNMTGSEPTHGGTGSMGQLGATASSHRPGSVRGTMSGSGGEQASDHSPSYISSPPRDSAAPHLTSAGMRPPGWPGAGQSARMLPPGPPLDTSISEEAEVVEVGVTHEIVWVELVGYLTFATRPNHQVPVMPGQGTGEAPLVPIVWAVSLFGTERDVSSEIAAREAGEREREGKAAANAAIDAAQRSLAFAAHELRGPLHSISASLELLSEYAHMLPSEGRKDFDSVTEGAHSLRQLVDDILDSSKLRSGGTLTLRPGRVDVRQLMGLTAHQHESFAIVPLVLDVAPQISSIVLSDGTRLRQCLTNGITNAAKHTFEGCIQLRAFVKEVLPPLVQPQAKPGGATPTSKPTPRSVSSSVGSRGRTPMAPRAGTASRSPLVPTRRYVLRLEIIDTGTGLGGIDPEALFTEFAQGPSAAQARIVGTGLGLPIVRRLSQLLGGACGIVEAERPVPKALLGAVIRVAPDGRRQLYCPALVRPTTGLTSRAGIRTTPLATLIGPSPTELGRPLSVGTPRSVASHAMRRQGGMLLDRHGRERGGVLRTISRTSSHSGTGVLGAAAGGPAPGTGTPAVPSPGVPSPAGHPSGEAPEHASVHSLHQRALTPQHVADLLGLDRDRWPPGPYVCYPDGYRTSILPSTNGEGTAMTLTLPSDVVLRRCTVFWIEIPVEELEPAPPLPPPLPTVAPAGAVMAGGVVSSPSAALSSQPVITVQRADKTSALLGARTPESAASMRSLYPTTPGGPRVVQLQAAAQPSGEGQAGAAGAGAPTAAGGAIARPLPTALPQRVLLVDDNATNRRLSSRLLARIGVPHVDTAGDGVAAMETMLGLGQGHGEGAAAGAAGPQAPSQLHQYALQTTMELPVGIGEAEAQSPVRRWLAEHPWPYDALLLDIGLPRKGGDAVAAHLRALGCALPMVAVTGTAGPADVSRLLGLGFDRVLAKPFDMAQLKTTIMEATAEAVARTTAAASPVEGSLSKGPGPPMELPRVPTIGPPPLSARRSQSTAQGASSSSE